MSKMLCHAEYIPYLELLGWDFRVAAPNRPNKVVPAHLLCVMMEIDTLCETFCLGKHKMVDVVQNAGHIWYCVCFRRSL